MSYVVAVKSLSDIIDATKALPKDIQIAARNAVNGTLRRTRTASSKAIRNQIAFGAAYLDQNKRLSVTKFATTSDPAGTITGRDRPTSLARFATKSGRGVTIQVKPGASRHSKKAFFIKLKSGSASIETKFNLGLAIRLKAGEKIDNKTKMIKISQGLYALYGPSVAQIFKGVADAAAPEAAQYLETEFLRLMEL